MKRYIIAVVALVLSAAAMMAQTVEHSLVVNKKSGETVEYKFKNDPKVSFVEQDMVITTGTDNVHHPIADLQNLTFSKTVGLDNVTDKKADIIVTFTGETIIFEGLDEGMVLAIFSLDGKKLADGRADSDGRATVAISDLEAGVYVASSPIHSFKFVK